MSTIAAVDLRCLAEPYGSGVATYTKAMLSALAREPEILKTQWYGFTSGRRSRRLDLPWPYTPRHVPVSNTLFNLSVTLAGWPRVEQSVGPVDFFWQPNPMFTAVGHAKHYVTVHDLSFLHYPEFFPMRTRRWYVSWVTSFLRKFNPRVWLMAVSKHTRDDILEQFPWWQDHVIVQAPPPPPLNEVERLTSSAPYILAVGTLEPRKNVPALLEAYRAFRRDHQDVSLVLLGRETASWRRYWRTAPASPGLIIKGYVSTTEREDLYRRASVVVYPSFYEGYGLPPLEAMAWGVPVIASNLGSMPEVLGPDALLIDPFRGSEEIEKALYQIFSDRSFATQLAARGRERIRSLSAAYNLEPLLRLWYDRA